MEKARLSGEEFRFVRSATGNLRAKGRDVFPSWITEAYGEAEDEGDKEYRKTIAIRERWSSWYGRVCKGIAFRFWDALSLKPHDPSIRALGRVLYKWGDSWQDVTDADTQEALKMALWSFRDLEVPNLMENLFL